MATDFLLAVATARDPYPSVICTVEYGGFGVIPEPTVQSGWEKEGSCLIRDWFVTAIVMGLIFYTLHLLLHLPL
jgi:hypothetical protein